MFVENPDKSGQSPARMVSNGVLVGRAKKVLGVLGHRSRPLSLPETPCLLWPLLLRVDADTVRRSMAALLVALFAALRSSIRSRLDLEAEILALRHQLAVVQRQAPRRPRLYRTDRLLWVLLSRLWPNWRGAVQIVTPDTVVHWHWRGFALSWQWRSRPRRAGRPAVERVIGSIRREYLDHVVVWNERSLRRHLQQYLAYYHQWRTHLSLDKDPPVPRRVQPPAAGTIVQVPHLGGLHHHDERRAA